MMMPKNFGVKKTYNEFTEELSLGRPHEI